MFFQFAAEVGIIGRHVKITMSAQVEQNRFAHAFFLAFLCFLNRCCDSVICFRCRNDSFCSGKQYARFETFELMVRSVLIYVLVAVSPLSFAAMVWPAARGILRDVRPVVRPVWAEVVLDVLGSWR